MFSKTSKVVQINMFYSICNINEKGVCRSNQSKYGSVVEGLYKIEICIDKKGG